MVVEVLGNTILNTGGNIDVSGKGFRGGALLDNNTNWAVFSYVTAYDDFGAEKGEGIAGYQTDYDPIGGRYAKGAPANGGGGATSHNAGGGGGANAGSIASWTGRGNPDMSTASWSSAWNLEYSGFASSTSSGGGKGGYTFSGSNQNALVVGPNNTLWGGDNRSEQGGRGGRPLNYSTGKIFLAGGGGAADQNGGYGGAGGAGGGMVYLLAYGDVSGSGAIRANGANGGSTTGSNGTDGAGGAGGGGTVLIPALGTISGIIISANGGVGGNQVVNFFTVEAEGPGGGGGGGYIGISNGAISKFAAGAQNGTTNSLGLTEFPPNGATKGGAGEPNAVLPVFKININSPQTVCQGSAATLTYTTTGTAPVGTNLGWYDAAIGGNLLGSGTSYTTPIITGPRTVYIGSCPGVYRKPVLIDVDQLSSSFTSSTICQGGTTTFSANASSSLGSITSWTWNFGDGSGASTLQNPTYTYSTSGTFSVILSVSDDKGCSSVSTNPVVVIARPTINIAASPVSGCLPLTVQFNNSSSNANAYTWNFGDGSATSSVTNPSHVYTSSGSYSVIITASNAAGCTSSQTQTNMIQTSASPTAVFSASSASVCLADTLYFVDASIPNGSSIVSRSWNFGDGSALSSQTNPSHVFMSPGTYQVVLTVSSGSCSHDTSLSVQVNPGPVVSFSSSIQVGCNPLSVSFTNTTSGAPVYSWNFGDGSALSSVVSPTHIYPNSGTYSVTLIATQGSCADTVRVQSMIVVYPKPGAAFNSNSNLCLGDTVFFANTSTSNGGITGYSWDFGDGSALSTLGSPYHLYSSPGSYQVTLRCSTNQCVDDTIKTVVISPSPQATFTTNLTNGCSPLLVNFSNSTVGTASYTWNFGDGSNSTDTSPSHTYVSSGSYTVSLIATQGSCVDTVTFPNLISIATKPTAAFSSTALLCLGDTLFTQNSSTWNGSAPGTYSWNFGDGSTLSTATNPPHIYQNAGTYTLNLIANNGQCIDDSSLTIQVAPSPQVAFSAVNGTSCFPAAVQFTNTTGGNPSFSWDFGDNSSLSSLRNPSHNYSSPGTYNVSLIATQGSCSDTLSIPALINILASPLADFSFSSPCVDDSLLFTNLTQALGSNISSYAWNFGDGGPGSSNQNPRHLYSASGNYNVTLVVQSSNGCIDSIQKNINVLARPLISFSTNVQNGCDSLTVQFNNSSLGAANYSWSFGDGANATASNPVYTYSVPGIYSVSLTATATGGCSASRSYVNYINVRPRPVAQFTSNNSTICPGDCVSFQDLSGSTINSWTWSFPGANPSSAGNGAPTSVCYPVEGVFDVGIQVSDGFCSSTKNIPAFIHVVDCSAIPAASFISSDSSVCGGGCLSFVSMSLNATSWNWFFPGGTPATSTLESPQNICYQIPGNYSVSLIVSNISGSDTLMSINHIQVYSAISQPTFTQHGDSLLSSVSINYQWYLNGIAISGAISQLFIAPLTGNYSVEVTDANGCSSRSSTKFVSLVGVDEISENTYVLLYPNPVVNELQVFFYSTRSGKVDIKIYSVLGQLLLSQREQSVSGENKFSIITGDLASGPYLFRLESSDKIIVRRIARQ